MKTLLQIFSLLVLLGCNEKPKTNPKPEFQIANSEETSKKIKTVEFKPDSSYVEYWCSMEVLKMTSENLTNLTLNIVAEFLASFYVGCSQNIEFTEWSNELLFEVAIRKPDFLLELLNKNSSLDKKLIKKQFENPVNDRFEMNEIISSFENSNYPTMIKEEIIESLKVANLKSE